MINWLKDRIRHKFSGFSRERISGFLKENGLAFVIIVVGWEIVEDVVFPIIFAWLGNYVHPGFYVGVPASLILCFHWLAIPILWGLWLKIKKNNQHVEFDDCCSKEE